MAGNRKKVKFFIQVSPLKKRSISALLEIYPINSMSKADGIGKEDAGMEAFMPLVSIAEALLIIRFGRFLKLIQ